jgi:hypothetical protein
VRVKKGGVVFEASCGTLASRSLSLGVHPIDPTVSQLWAYTKCGVCTVVRVWVVPHLYCRGVGILQSVVCV